jgi:seryl-tRNA synthetase
MDRVVQEQNAKIDVLQSVESKLMNEMKRKGDTARQLMKEKDKEIEALKIQLKQSTSNLSSVEHNLTVSTVDISEDVVINPTIDDLLSSDEVRALFLQRWNFLENVCVFFFF